MKLALLKACHSALVRSLTLPSTNPVHQVVQAAKRSQPQKHLGPLNNLLKIFELRLNTELETIYPAVTLKGLSPQHRVVIDNSREDSINSESIDNADFKVFTDGSGQHGGVRASAILYEKGRATPRKSLQVFLGTLEKHKTFEAETVRAIFALWILQNVPATVGKKVTLYTDNQSIATALPYPKVASGQYLLNALRTAIEGTGCRLTIKWISGHSKVRGNEEADRVAKNAAQGLSSARAALPHILRSTLPTSTSARKQEFMQELKSKWSDMWENSPRKQKIAQYRDEFPFNALLVRLSSLTRSQSSLVMQLRCGHFPLNSYLHKINKADSNRCTGQHGMPQRSGPRRPSFP
jgi:ribonuclease HI